MPQAKLSDPSGRGKAEGFKVIFPMMQHPYTEAEIQAVVDVMRNAEGQTQGKYLEKFEKDFAAFVGAKYAFGVNNCTNALKLAAIFCHIQPGDEVIVIAPYFPEYRVWIETAGATCIEVMADSETFQIDTEAVRVAVTPRTKAVVINSPNNPVGSVYSAQNLAALADVLHEREDALGTAIYLVADEPYREISYGVEVPWVPAIYDRTLVCYSYSKSLSLPGERIGWVLVPPTNPDHDRLVYAIAGAGRSLGFVCAPALFQRVVADCCDVPSDVEAYTRNREALTRGLSELGYHYIEPQGAFYLWVKALEPDANAFFERAKALELLPVPSDSFGCTGWVRIGYCVSYETIVNSMPAWKKLAESYK